MTTIKRTTLLFILCSAINISNCIARTLDYKVDAYDLKTNQLIYRERHIERYQGNQPISFEVQYSNPQGVQFATKTVRFSSSPYDPDISLFYPRLNYTEFTQHLTQNVYRVGTRKPNKKALRTRQLKVPSVQVIDNGFDLYIKDNMHQLRQGKTLKVNYIAPARLDYYHFRMKPITNTTTTIKIKIESDVMLIRWLTHPIIVEYDVINNRMTSYKGITNIPKSNMENHRAKLVMKYA